MIARAVACRRIAVTGVSRDPMKFGHKIYFFLKRREIEVYAVNPNADCLQEDACVANLSELPVLPELVVTVTQPWVTAATVREALELGIKRIWMQPGSESKDAIAAAKTAGADVIFGGPCIMVEMGRAVA